MTAARRLVAAPVAAARCLPAAATVAALLALLCVTAAATAAPAHAAETETFELAPDPPTLDGEPRRGFVFGLAEDGSATDTVRLTNKSAEPRRFRLYGAGVTTTADGIVQVAPYESRGAGVGRWIVPEQQDVVLPAGASAVVPFTVTRPAGGSGTGAVVAEELPPTSDAAGVEVVFRLALLVHVGEPSAVSTALGLDDVRLDLPVALVPGTATVVTTVANHGDRTVTGAVRPRVHSLTGREWLLDPVEVTLEPGERRDVTSTWTTVPRWGGAFTPASVVTWEGGNAALDGRRAVLPPVWLVALAIGAVGERTFRALRTRGRSRAAGSTAAALQ